MKQEILSYALIAAHVLSKAGLLGNDGREQVFWAAKSLAGPNVDADTKDAAIFTLETFQKQIKAHPEMIKCLDEVDPKQIEQWLASGQRQAQLNKQG